MVVAYPPFFPSQILDGAGQPVANGRVLAYFAGSDVPAPLFTPDGTALGSSVTLNSSGEAVFCLRAGTAYKLTCLDAQGATVWTRDNVRVTTSDSGMANPMEAQADMIVGAVDGQPERLAAPANASFLRSYKNSDNVPVVKWSQLKAGANVTITDAGTQVTVAADTQPGDHKAQVSATDSTPNYLQNKIVTGDLVQVEKQQTPDGEGGYIESLRLNLDARGVTAGYVPTANGSNGSAWAAPAPQPGDHKTAVDGADASPDYLAAKLSAGSGISLTNTGSAVEIAATAQTGDHQLLVSATDAAAGYLGAKLTAGANVTLTPQTDGDGVQTLEISATGGGGGGASAVLDMAMPIGACNGSPTTNANQNLTHVTPIIATRSGAPSHVVIVLGATTSCTLRGYIFNSSGAMLYYGEQIFTSNPNAGFAANNISVFKIPVSAVNGAVAISATDALYVGFCSTAGQVKIWGQTAGGGTGSNLYGKRMSGALNSGDSITYSSMTSTGYLHPFGILFASS